MDKEHVVILVVGKTGVGKSELINRVCKRTGAKALISYTTRQRRSEKDVDHQFVTYTDYERMLAEGKIAMSTDINGVKYWSTVEQLYEADFYTVDPRSVKPLKDLNLPNIRFVTVYIHAPDDVREYRAIHSRGDDKIGFRVRSHAESSQFKELERSMNYDYSIKNINLPKAYSVLRWISIAEGVLIEQDGGA